MGQSLSPDTDVGSFVVYRPPHGEKYHTQPTCATTPDIPPVLDLAESALDKVEMYRVEEIREELNGSQHFCSNCAADIARELPNS